VAQSSRKKLDKIARKTIVTVQRSAQAAREHVYRMRSVMELAMDVDTVEASLIAQAEAAHAALAKAESAIEECAARVAEMPVAEDYADA
jgi:hypothetical protein